MSLGGIVRHEQAQRGAHEGSSGQLYRPTARDGAVGHARGQVVQVRPPMLLGRTADRPVFVSVRQQRNTSFANIALSRLRITPSLLVCGLLCAPWLCGLPKTRLPLTRVNKNKRKGRHPCGDSRPFFHLPYLLFPGQFGLSPPRSFTQAGLLLG
jgi:hypothetical protein